MNILITGASKGIGKAVALHLAKDPQHTVVALSRSIVPEKDWPSNVVPLVFDLMDADKMDALKETLQQKIQHIDLLINNAGLLVNKPFAEITDEEWTSVYETNVFAPARLIRTLLPMLKADSHVVNISSMGGVQGSQKFPGLSAYSSSKMAIAGLTECLAVELAPKKISVNCLCPGAVDTEMLQAAFPGFTGAMPPAQIAAFIAWFGLNGHKTMNGKILPLSLSTP